MKATVVIAAVLAAAAAVLLVLTGREVRRAPVALNPGGGATALVVVHPGLSDFPDSVVHAFANGLVERGWQVRLVTANPDAPADLSPFGLLALAGPVYWWSPAPALTRYVRRVGDLHGTPVAVVLTGAGQGERALARMQRTVEHARGKVVRSLVVYTLKPNDERLYGTVPNRRIAFDLARAAGAAIAPPP